MAAETARRTLHAAHNLIADRGYAAFSYANIADQIRCMRKTEPMCVAALRGAELPSLPADVAKETRLHFVAPHWRLRKTMELGLKQKTMPLITFPSIEAE